MKDIPESKKEELLEALKALASVFEGAEEKQDENLMPEELESAIKELHNLAEKHDKTFIMAMETHDTDEASGQCLSCYGTIGKQLKLICTMLENIAEAAHKPVPDILKDITKYLLLRELLSDGEEGDDASE